MSVPPSKPTPRIPYIPPIASRGRGGRPTPVAWRGRGGRPTPTPHIPHIAETAVRMDIHMVVARGGFICKP